VFGQGPVPERRDGDVQLLADATHLSLADAGVDAERLDQTSTFSR
jgi:hypothetical protein